MTTENDLLVNTGRYLYGVQSLADLAEWVQDHEEEWAALSSESEYRRLAGTIMLAAYEVHDAVRDEAYARTLIRDAASDLPEDSSADVAINLTHANSVSAFVPESEETRTTAASLTAVG